MVLLGLIHRLAKQIFFAKNRQFRRSKASRSLRQLGGLPFPTREFRLVFWVFRNKSLIALNQKIVIQCEGNVVCTQCGIGEVIIIDSDKPNFKDMSQDNTHYCYKRINHFNEYLSQVQAKESTDINQEIYDTILLEIKKRKIENLALLTPDMIKSILKKLKLNKYYEHAPYIINKINGLPAPKMSREIENKLRTMFKETQGPFMEICPKTRKNFLSYSYVLHKMCQLL